MGFRRQTDCSLSFLVLSDRYHSKGLCGNLIDTLREQRGYSTKEGYSKRQAEFISIEPFLYHHVFYHCSTESNTRPSEPTARF